MQRQEGQIASWIFSILIAAVLVGFLITQAGPVIANHISLRGTANEIADYAADAYRSSRGDLAQVEKKVRDYLKDKDVRLAGQITVQEDEKGKAEVICVPVRKIVNTFLFKNISYLASYTEAQAVGKANIY